MYALYVCVLTTSCVFSGSSGSISWLWPRCLDSFGYFFLEGYVVIFPFLYHQSLTISHLALLVTVIFFLFDSLKFSLLYFSGFTSVCFLGVLSTCLLDFLSVLLSLLSRSWIYFHTLLISLCEVSLRLLISFKLNCCVVLHFNHFCIF